MSQNQPPYGRFQGFQQPFETVSQSVGQGRTPSSYGPPAWGAPSMQSPVAQPINPVEQSGPMPTYQQPTQSQLAPQPVQSHPPGSFLTQAVTPMSTQLGPAGQATFQTPVGTAPAQSSGSSPVGSQLAAQPMAGAGQSQWSEWGPQLASSGPMQSGSELGAGPSQTQFGSAEIPLIDLYEETDEFIVLVNLPGFDSEEIKLEASNDSLRVVAQRDEDREDEAYPVQRERLNRAERLIQLPGPISIENADATCVDGVCRITLPKTDESQRHRIGVH